MLKRIVAISAVCAVAFLIYQNKLEKDRIEEQRQAEANQRTESVRANVTAMAGRHGANTEWAQILAGGKRYRSRPIMSVELENAWVEASPILFWASIKDIASLDGEYYQVDFRPGYFGNFELISSTELRWSLRAKRSVIDDMLQRNPGMLDRFGFNDGVAVVATIESISASEIVDSEGIIDVKTGHGDVVDLKYTSNVRPKR